MARRKAGASPDVHMELLGEDELRRLFSRMPKRLQDRWLRKAVNAAALPILRTMRQTANKDSGLLKKSLGRKTKLYRKDGTAVAIVGARRSVSGTHNGRTRVPANYLHLAENGHIDAKTGKHIPGSHFMRKSYESQKGAAQQALVGTMSKGVLTEAKS